jgi:hypothetical protein
MNSPIEPNKGDFVVVQADRGEDLGIVTDSYPLQSFLDRRYAMRAYMDEEDQNVGYILRIASAAEKKLLPQKFHDEEMIFKVFFIWFSVILFSVPHSANFTCVFFL